MKTLLVYDEDGKVFHNSVGLQEDLLLPNGLPFLLFDMPEGKRLKSSGTQLDMGTNPPTVLLEDIPKSDLQSLREELQMTQEVVNFLLTK